MSKFFAASSGSESESSDDDQPIVVKQAPVISRLELLRLEEFLVFFLALVGFPFYRLPDVSLSFFTV